MSVPRRRPRPSITNPTSPPWADYNTAIVVRGFSNNGLVQDGGCCAMNCNNASQIYSFHRGGANALRGDGSVSFLAETVVPSVIAALITRAGGETLTDTN